jgi:hypothetical protein
MIDVRATIEAIHYSHERSLQPLNEQKMRLKLMLNLFSCPFSPSNTASRIRYEITSGNIGGAFAVKNMTGAIYVAGALDYETRKRVSTKLLIFFEN